MGTPLIVRSSNDLIYDYQLSSAYRSSWVYDPSYALRQEPDIWEVAKNDVVILSAMQRRNASMIRTWRVVPNSHAQGTNGDKKVGDASKRLAGICSEAIGNIDRFDAARRALSEAFFLGRRYGIVLWEPKLISLDGLPEMEWQLPYKIKDIDRRRFHWVTDWAAGPAGTQKKTGVHIEMFNTNTSSWEKISNEQRRNLIEYIYQDTEDRVGYGRGVLESIYFYLYFKQGTFKKIAEAVDRYANGVLIGRLDSLRNASSDKTNADMVTSMKTLLQNFRSEHVVVLGDGDEIEIKEPTGTGVNIAMDFLHYLDESVERLCNGSVRPSGHSMGGTGARAQAETESDTSEGFYQDDREDLDCVIDRDLLGAFLYHNQDNISQLGLDIAKRPRFTSEQIKRKDPSEAVEIMNKALSVGVPLLRSEYYDRIEMTPPAPDDDTVEQQMMDPMGGGFGGGLGSESGERNGKQSEGKESKDASE